MVWWLISGRHPNLVRKCSVMSKILSHASIFRDDDFKLKDQLNTFKMCDLCDRYEIEDARHLILHCPFFPNARTIMFEKINEVEENADFVLNECNVDMLYILLGRMVDGPNRPRWKKSGYLLSNTSLACIRRLLRCFSGSLKSVIRHP